MAVKKIIGETSREKRKKRKIRPTILIISEGKDTEVNYFKEFNMKHINIDIKIADGNSVGKNKSRKTDPSNLVDKAIEYMEYKYDINEKDGDRVWCLIDVDLNYNNPDPINQRIIELEKAHKKAISYAKKSQKNIHLGISNPCFELWYFLHFKYTTAYLKNYDAVKSKLKSETPIKDYEKNKCIYNLLEDKMSEAIKNGEKLKAYHKNNGKNFTDIELDFFNLNIKNVVESNPYTNVVDLIKYIKEINKNSIEE